jgi:hypothetical protein
MTRPHPARAALAAWATGALLAASIAVNALTRFGTWSGDAVIHLALAERAARGAWWEFNPGEVASASTSPGWTALMAALVRLGGVPLALTAVPALSLAALLTTCALVFHLARQAGAPRVHATLGALAFAALPGVARNALLGMENVAFAAVALGLLAVCTGAHRGAGSIAATSILLALAVLLRPEGVLLAAVPLVATHARPRELRGRAMAGAVLAVLAAVALVAPVALAHHAVTGQWLPGSGISRVMAARRARNTWHVGGPVWLYGATLLRLAAYAPLGVLAVLGARRREGERSTRRALVTVVLGATALYTLATGAAHVGRVTTWLFAALCALAAAGISPLAARRRGPLALAALGTMFFAVMGAETLARARSPEQGGYPAHLLATAYARRAAETDRVRAGLCDGGCCTPGTIPAIATHEVQLRFFLDARVAVASFDGRTRARTGPLSRLAFDARGCPGVDALLAEPQVVAVREPPSFQLPGCPRSALVAALEAAWNGDAPPPPGWRWSERAGMFVRVCPAH